MPVRRGIHRFECRHGGSSRRAPSYVDSPPMTRFHPRVLALVSFVALAGCGGTPPAASPTGKPAGTVVMPEGQVSGKAPPDLSPVAAPAELFGVGRLKNPGGLVDRGLAWAGLPIDWRALLQKKDPEMARVLAPNVPIDFALALDPSSTSDEPKPMFAIAVPLNSVDGALDVSRKRGWSVRMIKPGVYRVTNDDDDCAVAAAVGPAPARLVCGDSAANVDALLPYLTRGLPNEKFADSDLHVELRAAPFQKRYAHQLRRLKMLAVPFVLNKLQLDNPAFDRALADAVHGVADEALALAEDLDEISVDAWMRDDPQVIDAKASLRFKADSSWTAQTLLDSATRASAPQEAFWRLPGDATTATYGVTPNPKRFTAIQHTISEMLDGYLAHENVPRRTRDQLVDLTDQLFTMEGAAVSGHGPVPSTITDYEKASRAARARDAVRASLGWYVVGIDEKPDRYRKFFGELTRAYNDPQIQKMLKKADAKAVPKLRTRGARGAGLAPGSTAYELKIPGELFAGHSWEEPGAKKKPKAAEPPLSIVLIVMPDGNRTWVGFSTDEAVLASKLAAVRKPNDPKSLASREGLAQLKSAKAISGGFMSLGALASSASALRKLHIDGSKVLATLPHKGETPITYTLSVSRDHGVSLDYSVRVPRAVVEDIAAAATAVQGAGAHIAAP